MTDRSPRIGDADLHAFVDGELDEARHAEIEAWLAAHPEDAARIEAWRRQVAGLHALFDPVADERPPERLHPSAVLARQRAGRGRIAAQAAAAVLLLLVGGVAGWMLNDRAGSPGGWQAVLTREAAQAHRIYTAEVRHAVEVGAEEEHLFRWLSNRLGGDVKAPPLDELGFHLVGGRLLPSDQRVAAQFLYEDEAGRRLTLYIKPGRAGRMTAFHYAEDNSVDGGEGVNAFYWAEEPFEYALLGSIGREELLHAARTVYANLSE
jgi:anti-sigma factor RsiW